jgi:hypothetical protein
MAGRLNRFGCTSANVMTFLATGSYNPVVGDFGGEPSVAAFMDLATDEIIQVMPEDMFQSMFDVDLELVVLRATKGQFTFQVGLFPVVANQFHVWKGQPVMFKTRPRLLTELLTDMTFTDPELIPLAELNYNTANPADPSNQYSFDVATGQGSLNPTLYPGGMTQNDKIYCTYSADPTTLSIPSLLQLVCTGTVAKMGPKFFARASTTWQFIDDTREDYANKIQALRKGSWIPPEIRIMRFWEERMPEEDKEAIMQVGRLIRA